MRARVASLAFLLAGCDVLFPLKAPPVDAVAPMPATPLQQRTASRIDTDPVPGVLTFTTDPTGQDHALIVVAMIRSTSQPIESVIDDGGNLWARGLNGNNDSDDVGSPMRVEIWYATSTSPAQLITVTEPGNRPFAVLFGEWDTGAPVSPSGQNTRGDEVSGTAISGDLVVAQRTLVIATAAFNTATTATLTSEGFETLSATTAMDIHGATAVGLVTSGTVGVEWSLDADTARWNAGIVGFSF